MNLIKQFALVALLCSTLTTACCNTQMSLTRMLDASVTENNGALELTFQRSGRKLLDQTPLVIKYNDEVVEWKITGQKDRMVTDEIEMSTGEFSELKINSTERTYSLKAKNVNLKAELKTRLFNGALAYQFVIYGKGDYTIEEQSHYRLGDGSGSYFAPNGEFETFGPLKVGELPADKQYTTPVVYQTEEYALGFHEAELRDYPQLLLKRNGEALTVNAGVAECTDTKVLPWRVVMIGNTMADLQNQKPIYQALNPAPKGDFSWVKPGLSMWDWRVKGCTFDGFTYKMNTESLKRYIDFCAKSNLEYFLIDDEWCIEGNPLVPVKALDIEAVISYGKEKGVGIILYYDLRYIKKGEEVPFETVAETFASWGVSGIKYGFLDRIGTSFSAQGKTYRTEELVQIAAKNKLVIDFHDNPIPFGGLERTYPNYITREYCHAQLDRRMAFTPAQFVKMACVNLLSGMMDQTNGTFALNEMASRSKGPRNEYISTVSAEVARFLITHTGHLAVLIDAPEAYAAKSDLFEFITSAANSWDESRYLEMEFDSHVSVARRKGNDWFVGTVVNEEFKGDHTMRLDFLESGATYSATIYSDAADSNCHTNKESYEIKTITVKGGSEITTHVAAGGGYSVHFVKK